MRNSHSRVSAAKWRFMVKRPRWRRQKLTANKRGRRPPKSSQSGGFGGRRKAGGCRMGSSQCGCSWAEWSHRQVLSFNDPDWIFEKYERAHDPQTVWLFHSLRSTEWLQHRIASDCLQRNSGQRRCYSRLMLLLRHAWNREIALWAITEGKQINLADCGEVSTAFVLPVRSSDSADSDSTRKYL